MTLFKAATLVVATFITFGVVIQLYDNRDLKLSSSSLENEEPLPHDARFKDVQKKYENYCLDGKDRNSMNEKEKFESFLAGPCAPMLMIPGVLGTALQVEIECETLQDNYPKIFNGCGWSTCSAYNIFSSRPSEEYRLWVGDLFSKTNIVQFNEDSTCFGDLFSLVYDPTQNKLVNKPGIKATWYGNTPETKSKSQCGSNAIQNLSDDIIIQKASCSVGGFRSLIALLEAMGYQSGLTYQAIPYDFRQSAFESDSNVLVSQAVDHLYNLTEKKVVLVGHSLGTLQLQNSLSNMSKEMKELKVLEFIAAGPPFLGAPKSISNLLGGDSEYLQKVLGKEIGLNFYSQHQVLLSSSSIFDLFPRDIFDEFKGQDWTEEILKRIDYEKNMTSPLIENDENKKEEAKENEGPSQPANLQDLNAPFHFFPNPKDQCLKKDKFPERKEGLCMTGLHDLLNPFIVKIEQKEFKGTEQDFTEIISKHGFVEEEIGLGLFNKSNQAKGLRGLQNPEVPITVIYGNNLSTLISSEYKQSTRKHFLETNSFYFPESQEVGLGDGTVPAYSALVPALKWAFEELNNKQGAKRVRIFELCSHFQGYPQQEEKERSSYRGIDCQCQHGGEESCYHSCFLNDSFFVDEIASTLIEKPQRITNLNKRYSEEELKKIVNECPALQIKS